MFRSEMHSRPCVVSCQQSRMCPALHLLPCSFQQGVVPHSYYAFKPAPGWRFLLLDGYDVSILGWPPGGRAAARHLHEPCRSLHNRLPPDVAHALPDPCPPWRRALPCAISRIQPAAAKERMLAGLGSAFAGRASARDRVARPTVGCRPPAARAGPRPAGGQQPQRGQEQRGRPRGPAAQVRPHVTRGHGMALAGATLSPLACMSGSVRPH